MGFQRRLSDRGHGRKIQGLHSSHRYRIAIVERTEHGEADLYVADRKTGAPVSQADLALWSDGKLQSTGKTASDGLATLTMNSGPSVHVGGEPENVWILARHGADAAIITPWAMASANRIKTRQRLYLHRPAGVSAWTHGAHQSNRSQGTDRQSCATRRTHAYVARVGPGTKLCLKRKCGLCARNGGSGLRSRVRCGAGLLRRRFQGQANADEYDYADAGSFYVESTRSPSIR